jgi:hypothetical protein
LEIVPLKICDHWLYRSMSVTVIDDDPWMMGAGMVLSKAWANSKTTEKTRFIVGFNPAINLGNKTIAECLVIDTISNISQIIVNGDLDRFDSFMIADKSTWEIIASRYGEAVTFLVPLPSIYSERFAIDRIGSHHWAELRSALDAADPVLFTTLNTLQWCIYNRRDVQFPPIMPAEVSIFLNDIGTTVNDFIDPDLVRNRFINRYPDILTVIMQQGNFRATGPFWVADEAERIASIVKIIEDNWNGVPVKEAREFASFAITGHSNSSFPNRDWIDITTTITELFNEYRLRALPYQGAIDYLEIQTILASDKVRITTYVDDIIQRWSTVKTGNTVIDSQHLAYITTGNPDAEYVSYIIDANGNQTVLETILKSVLYEYNLDTLFPLSIVNLSINKNLQCFNLSYIAQNVYRGTHRSGWQYVMDYLSQLDSKTGVLFDGYLDRSFHWNLDIMKTLGLVPYLQPWSGFIHHTALTGKNSPYNAALLLQKPEFIQSLASCQGLFVLSKSLRDWLRVKLDALGYVNLEIVVLTHPTEIPQQLFTIEKFLEGDRQIVQIGGWMRDNFNIYKMDLGDNKLKLNKAALRGKNMDIYFKPQLFDSQLAINCISENTKMNPNSSNYSASLTQLINPTTFVTGNIIESQLITEASTSSSLASTSSSLASTSSPLGSGMCTGSPLGSGMCTGSPLGSGMCTGSPLGSGMCTGSPLGSGMCTGSPLGSGMCTGSPLGSGMCTGSPLGSGMCTQIQVSSILENSMLTLSEQTINEIAPVTGRNLFIRSIKAWLRDAGMPEINPDSLDSVIITDTLRDQLRSIIDRVRVISRVSNSEYDKLLAENIVAIKLFDASAVNTINECVVRGTPIIINRLPAVIEILGEDYPLYMADDGTIEITLENLTAAHIHLINLAKQRFTIEYFLENMLNSSIGRRCWLINHTRSQGYDWDVVSPYILSVLSKFTGQLTMITYFENMLRIYDEGILAYNLRDNQVGDLPRQIGHQLGIGLTNIYSWSLDNMAAKLSNAFNTFRNSAGNLVNIAGEELDAFSIKIFKIIK